MMGNNNTSIKMVVEFIKLLMDYLQNYDHQPILNSYHLTN